MTGLLLLGISKAVAVVGFREPDLYERLRGGPETAGLLGLAVDHLRTHLLRGGRQEEDREHQLVQWSLLFYCLENYESELGDPELAPALVQLALATAGQQEVARPLYTTLLTGLERLVVAGTVRGRALE